eukprot:1454146-Prymnesium_polylepis.1
MPPKLGKNEKKRLEAQAMADFDGEELTDDQRQAMLRKGMGNHEGGLQKGEEKLFGMANARAVLSAVCVCAARASCAAHCH